MALRGEKKISFGLVLTIAATAELSVQTIAYWIAALSEKPGMKDPSLLDLHTYVQRSTLSVAMLLVGVVLLMIKHRAE